MKYILLAILCCGCAIWPFAERVAEDIEQGELDRAHIIMPAPAK